MMRTVAVKTSCPLPWKRPDRAPAHGGQGAGAEHARGDAAGDPDGSAGETLGRGEHDTDDEAGFEDFAEDDEEACEHGYGDAVAVTVPDALLGS